MYNWGRESELPSGVLLVKDFDGVPVLNKVVKLKSRANVFIILWGCGLSLTAVDNLLNHREMKIEFKHQSSSNVESWASHYSTVGAKKTLLLEIHTCS
jgi:hypothetical protein